MSTGEAIAGQVFSAPEARCKRFTAWVLEQVDAKRPLRVLDIGCGTGAQLFDLAVALPQAHLTGVDISPANVAIARQRGLDLGLDQRVRFEPADYLAFRAQPQDVIISYSTLQLIPADDRALFGKIGSDLVVGGLLLNVMPYESPYNNSLVAMRRVFARLRSRATDEFVFRVGKLLHGKELSDEMIRERVGYMYQPLERLDGAPLRRLMADECGLDVIAEFPERHASVVQPRHRLIVSRKRSTAP